MAVVVHLLLSESLAREDPKKCELEYDRHSIECNTEMPTASLREVIALLE